MLPKRREKGLLTEDLPNETIVYDTTTHKVHCLNPVARLVWQHCTGRTSEASMVDILHKELSVEVDESLVKLTLEKLAAADLLKTEERTWFTSPTSRRQAAGDVWRKVCHGRRCRLGGHDSSARSSPSGYLCAERDGLHHTRQ